MGDDSIGRTLVDKRRTQAYFWSPAMRHGLRRRAADPTVPTKERVLWLCALGWPRRPASESMVGNDAANLIYKDVDVGITAS